MKESTEETLKDFMLFQVKFNRDLIKMLEKLSELIYSIDDKLDVKTGHKSLSEIVSKHLNKWSN